MTFEKNSSLYNELAKIEKWFKDNDWKVNKIVVGEWEKTDQRWIDYLNERQAKRARRDEILATLA